MDLTVWVDGWQMPCCGESFSVGQQVAWTLGDADEDWLMPMLGADTHVSVDAAEEHHGGIPEETPRTKGTVSRVTAVYCRYALAPGQDARTLYPVPGSAVLCEPESADGWPPEREDLEFVGYLVQLTS
jgi:hypothetical protein